MSPRLLVPLVPFLSLLFTRWRWAVTASATAGVLAGAWTARTIFPWGAERSRWWWMLFLYSAVISAVMAVAEAAVAALAVRGRLGRALLAALGAHALWLAWVFGLLDESARRGGLLAIVQAAMIGAAAATLGARPAGR